MDHSLARTKKLQLFVAAVFRKHVESVCVEFAIFSLFFAMVTVPISPSSSLSLLSLGGSHLKIGRGKPTVIPLNAVSLRGGI